MIWAPVGHPNYCTPQVCVPKIWVRGCGVDQPKPTKTEYLLVQMDYLRRVSVTSKPFHISKTSVHAITPVLADNSYPSDRGYTTALALRSYNLPESALPEECNNAREGDTPSVAGLFWGWVCSWFLEKKGAPECSSVTVWFGAFDVTCCRAVLRVVHSSGLPIHRHFRTTARRSLPSRVTTQAFATRCALLSSQATGCSLEWSADPSSPWLPHDCSSAAPFLCHNTSSESNLEAFSCHSLR